MDRGRIDLERMPDGIIESRGIGLITPVLAQDWADRIRVLRAPSPGGDLLLFDAIEVDYWAPGCATVLIRSARQHAGRTAAAAFVTRAPALIGLGSVMLSLMPAAPRAVFGSRSEALEFLRARPTDRRDAHLYSAGRIR